MKFYYCTKEVFSVFNKNRTSIIISIIYVIVAYIILRIYWSTGTQSATLVVIMPAGVVMITFLLTYVFKYDYFDKFDKDKNKK